MSTVKISEYTGTGSFGYVSSSGKLFAGITQDSDQSGTNVVVYNPTSGEFEYTGSYIGSDSVLTTASHAITASYLNQPLTEFSSSNISIDGFPDLSASLAGVTTPATASYAVSASHVTSASYATNAGTSTTATSATNASNAANVYITEANNDFGYGLLFRGNSGDGYQQIRADQGERSPTYNPSTNTLSSAYISASSDLYVGGTLSIDGHPDVSASLADLSTSESASYASTASYVANAVSSSYAVSASRASSALAADTAINSGFANVATQVVVNNTSNNLNYGLVFKSGDSDGANSLYADSENASPSYNPSTNTLSATYISASSDAYVSGTLNAASVTASVITATGKLAILPHFPNVSASLAAAVNPATASYAITASYANSANTAGASDLAITAVNAVNATNVDINNTSADDNYGLVFRIGNSGGNQALYADNQVASPSYNPSTNTLKATYISASSDLYVSGTLSINGYPDVSASLANLVNTNVNISGTPSNNQIAIFTDANTIEGDGNFTWTGTEFRIGSSGDTFKVISSNSITINNANDDVAFQVKGSSDNNLLQVNPQYTDKIGIGTLTPSEKLTVQGNISASGNIISSHITASGNISASAIFLGALSSSAAGKTPFVDFTGSGGIGGYGEYQIGVADNVFNGPSYSLNMKGYYINLESVYGVVSASAPDVLIQSQYSGYDNNEIRLGYASGIEISSDIVNITGPITASGDISASGDIIANSFTGTVITATTASYVAASNIDGTIDISDQTNLVGGTNLTLSGDTLNLDTNISLTDITASGDIVPSGVSGNIKYKLSASGDIIATTLKIKDSFFGSFDADTLRITYDGDYILEIANDADIDKVKIFKPTEIVGNISASGEISAYGSSSFHGLPTTEPSVTGALWISGSSPNHPNSGYLMVFNP